MSKIAFLYPGQGAQQAGMGADFYARSASARALYESAAAALDFDLKTVCFEEDERLHQTEYTQPAMVATCLAMTRVLREQGLEPDLTAGLSLGEYAALAAAGALTEVDAIRLVRRRGILMQNAVPAGEGGMAAVLGLSAETVEEVLAAIPGVSIANYNCPGQIVITGRTEAVRTAGEALKAAGARRVLPLRVSGPFHSPLMQAAGEALRLEMETLALRELQVPYVANVTAEKVECRKQIAELLTAGVSSPVKWQQSVETMLAEGVDTFIEIGPGRTLAGFIRKIAPDVTVRNVSAWEDIEKVAGEGC